MHSFVLGKTMLFLLDCAGASVLYFFYQMIGTYELADSFCRGNLIQLCEEHKFSTL